MLWKYKSNAPAPPHPQRLIHALLELVQNHKTYRTEIGYENTQMAADSSAAERPRIRINYRDQYSVNAYSFPPVSSTH
jgi:hypothetical protein